MTTDDVVTATCQVFDVAAYELLSPRAPRWGVEARDAAMLALRDRLALPFPVIGELFQRASVKTYRYVRAACTRARKRLAKDPEWRATYLRLERTLELSWAPERYIESLEFCA